MAAAAAALLATTLTMSCAVTMGGEVLAELMPRVAASTDRRLASVIAACCTSATPVVVPTPLKDRKKVLACSRRRPRAATLPGGGGGAVVKTLHWLPPVVRLPWHADCTALLNCSRLRRPATFKESVVSIGKSDTVTLTDRPSTPAALAMPLTTLSVVNDSRSTPCSARGAVTDATAAGEGGNCSGGGACVDAGGAAQDDSVAKAPALTPAERATPACAPMQAAKTAVLAGDTPARMNGMASAVMHGVQAVASAELVSSAQGATAEAKLCGADTGQVAASTGGGGSGPAVGGAEHNAREERALMLTPDDTAAPTWPLIHAWSVALSVDDTPAMMNGMASAMRHGMQSSASVVGARPEQAGTAPLKSCAAETGQVTGGGAAASGGEAAGA
jgi:hypothetical protein